MPTFFTPTPEKCQSCDWPFNPAPGTIMYDAPFDGRRGQPWGCFCDDPDCKPLGGYKIGLGTGQKYERQADGRFMLVAGAGTEDSGSETPLPDAGKLDTFNLRNVPEIVDAVVKIDQILEDLRRAMEARAKTQALEEGVPNEISAMNSYKVGEVALLQVFARLADARMRLPAMAPNPGSKQ